MKTAVPNGINAIIEITKLSGYLLAHHHPIGQYKARVFAGCGYDLQRIDDLIAQLRRIVIEGHLVQSVESKYGWKYIVDGVIPCVVAEVTMLEELDTVVIMRDIPERRIVAGDIGVIAHLYSEKHSAEVEFITGNGETIAVETVPVADLRPIGSGEILHVRSLESA